MTAAAWSPTAAVPTVNPDEAFPGVVLVTVPHMDDEALACGGTIARLRNKSALHLVYATDGSQAPEPVLPWIDAVSPDLGAVRRAESGAAMRLLGVPAGNLTFLDLPERRLERNMAPLEAHVSSLIADLEPDHVFTPFRYDRHRDHVALNRAVTRAVRGAARPIVLWEYFVYHHWRLLPRRDVRRYIRDGHLCQVRIDGVAACKRAALDCFRSQTTRFYRWQSRPILTSALLDGVCAEPELFLRYDERVRGAAVFERSVPWIRIAHRVESPLKRCKDRVVAVTRRLVGTTGGID